MERILTFCINHEFDGKTIHIFLKKEAGLSNPQIRSLKFRPNGILVNGVQQRVTYVLREGDRLSLSLEDTAASSVHLIGHAEHPEILYEDNDLLIVNKPAGILVHPVGGHYDDTLSNVVAAYFREKGENVVIRPVGRLDKDTSGAVLFAKNKIAAAWFSSNEKGKGFEKEYLALVHGAFPANQRIGEIYTPLSQRPGKPLKMRPDSANGKEAHTFYEVKTSYPQNYTLLKVKITTGRTHQIRVHMASIGHPLLGDSLYGTTPNPGDLFQRTALHAATLSFQHPFTHKQITITAPLPEDFRNFL